MAKNYFKYVKWALAQAACMTMVFSPVALGREAQELNRKYLEQSVKYFGLEKKITLGEFWEKSKSYMPGYVYKDLEQFVQNNKNMLMPEVSISVSNATDGTDVPVITFNQNGRTSRAQFFGEKNKWVKYNGVTLSSLDMERIQDAFKRIEASDIKMKNQADQYRKMMVNKQKEYIKKTGFNKYKADFARFKGFPRMTPYLWKSMSREQRVGFIIRMRLLWNEARRVLATTPQQYSDSRQTNYFTEYAKIENFYKIIFGQLAEAKTTAAGNDSKECIVAGYIGVKATTSNGRRLCSISNVIKSSEKPELNYIKDANTQCKTENNNSIACNPLVYGYPNDGKPACVNTQYEVMSYASYPYPPKGISGQTCDQQSPLNVIDVDDFKKIDAATKISEEEKIKAIEANQAKSSEQLSRKFLEGVLKHQEQSNGKNGLVSAFNDNTWNEELDNQLVEIQSKFESDIKNAAVVCSKPTTFNLPKQKEACEQLNRRWLFVEKEIAKLRSSACLDSSTYVGDYNDNRKPSKDVKLCACPGGDKKVGLGQRCENEAPVTLLPGQNYCPVPVVSGDSTPALLPPQDSTSPAPEPAKPSPVVTAPSDDTAPPVAASEPEDKKCIPPPAVLPEKDKCPAPEGVAGYDYEKCKCEDSKKLKQEKDGSYECEGTNWLPWILGGLGLVALFAIFHKKKKDKPQQPVTPPPGTCNKTCAAGVLNPTTCSCDIVPPTPSCEAPKMGTYPNCSCPATQYACTPPQHIYDANTCQCTDIPQPPVCADSTVAPNGNLTMCPKCPDGSYKTVAGCPVEGGTGNNCPQGNCSGGLPTNTGTGQ